MISKAMRQFRQVSPPWFFVVFFGCVYLATYGFDYWLHTYRVPVPEEIIRIRLLILCFFAGFYGAWREFYFHPFNSKGYVSFLVLTPWKWGGQLLYGPVHLVWADAVILTVVTGLSFVNGGEMPILPLTVFLAAYLCFLFWSFVKTGPLWVTVLWLLIGPLTVYPHKNPNIATAVLIFLYGVGYLGLAVFFKGFPWNTSFWKSDPVQEMRDRAIAQHIGWPYRELNINTAVSISVDTVVVLSLIVGWWVHVALCLADEKLPYGIVVVATFLVALGRLLIYVSSYHSPISFWGRIFTGRLIIPRYDQVFICPICILLAGIFAPRLFVLMGVAAGFSAELTLFVVLVLALGMPPNLKKWRLTSASRITRPVSRQRSTKATMRSSGKSTFKSALTGSIRQ